MTDFIPENTVQPNLQTTIFNFLKKHKLVTVSIVIAFYAIFSLFISFTQPNNNTQTEINNPTPIVTAYPSSSERTKTNNSSQSSSGQPGEDFEDTWAPIPFTEKDLMGTTAQKQQKEDGSTAYTYNSDNPNRHNIIITKDGIITFRRFVVGLMSIPSLTYPYGTPEYKAKGSYFWGANAVTYIYLERGLAFVVNENTNSVLEEIDFKPVDPKDYKKTYGDDLIGELQKQ